MYHVPAHKNVQSPPGQVPVKDLAWWETMEDDDEGSPPYPGFCGQYSNED